MPSERVIWIKHGQCGSIFHIFQGAIQMHIIIIMKSVYRQLFEILSLEREVNDSLNKHLLHKALN